MATAYDTFDMGQSLRDIGNTLVGGMQQRIAMSRDQTDRLAALEMQRIQQNAQRERDAELNRQYLERMEKQLELAEKAKERASLNDLKTEYAAKAGVRFEDAEGMDKAALISAIRAIDGTDDQYRLVELAKTEADLRNQASAEIDKMMASQNAQIDRELKKSSLLFKAISDTAGSKAATDWVNGELGIEAIRRELKSKPSKLEALQNAYVAAVAEASSRFTDADGRPIMDPAVLSRVQGLIGRAESVQRAVQTAIQNPNLPAGAVREAFGAGGAGAQGFERVEGIDVDVPIAGRSGDPMSAFMGGRAVGGDGQPQPQPIDPVPTQQASTPAPMPQPAPGLGIGGSTGFYAPGPPPNIQMPSLGAGVGIPPGTGVGLMNRALGGINAMGDAVGGWVSGKFSHNRFLGIPIGGGRPGDVAPIRAPWVSGGAQPQPVPAPVGSNAPAMIQGQGTAANPQNNPFLMQQVGGALADVFGPIDDATRTRAWQMALSEGRSEDELRSLLAQAFSGDPAARSVFQGYSMKAQRGAAMP